MQVSKDHVVSFHYSLKDSDGNELENSAGGDPVAYLQGHGNIIPGLEQGMEGRSEEEVFSITVQPKDGYGERQDAAVQRIPLKHLHGSKKELANLKPGAVVSINTEQGAKQVVVIKAGKFNVDVDTNHPLAGKTLTFEIEIQSIRAASEEEIAHGHAHGVGGHHH